MSGTGQVTLGEVRDGSGDPRGGLARVEGSSGRFGMGRAKHGEVRGRVGVPSGRFGTSRETFGEVRNGSGYSRGGPGRVGFSRGGSGRVEGP